MAKLTPMYSRAHLVPEKKIVRGRRGVHQQTYWVNPEKRVISPQTGKPFPPGFVPAQMTPELKKRLDELGVGKRPPKDGFFVVNENIHDDKKVHEKAVILWDDKSGKRQYGYTAKFDKRNADKKWDRAEALEPIADQVKADLKKMAPHSDAHAVALVMAETGLRIGGEKSLREKQHYGARTMEARHVTFESDSKAKIDFIGKEHQDNRAVITDKETIAILRSRAQGKGPNDRLFKTSEKAVRDTMPEGFVPKDLRTVHANRIARAELAKLPPPKLKGDFVKDRRAVKKAVRQVAKVVAQGLNNTPSVALKSYINPRLINAWLDSHGIPQELLW